MAAVDLVGTNRSGLPRAASLAVGGRASAALLLPDETGGLAEEWRALANEAVEDNHFFLPDVVLPATRHFGTDVRILTVRDGGGALIALMPVTATRLGRIAPALRIWSHHYGPFGVPL